MFLLDENIFKSNKQNGKLCTVHLQLQLERINLQYYYHKNKCAFTSCVIFTFHLTAVLSVFHVAVNCCYSVVLLPAATGITWKINKCSQSVKDLLVRLHYLNRMPNDNASLCLTSFGIVKPSS